MSVLPAPPLNWRRDALDRASQFLVNIPKDPNRPRNAQESEALELWFLLQQLLCEEDRIERDPEKMPRVLPGMTVQNIGTGTRFLVLATVEYGRDCAPVYGIRGNAPFVADSNRVCRVWDKGLHLIWQMPDAT